MTTSTINRSNPPANTPVASSVVRANFIAAANDIDALWAYVEALITGVSSFNGRTGAVTLESADVVTALGYNPSTKAGNYNWLAPVAGTYSLVPYAQYGFTINRLNNLVLGVGSLDLTVSINGTPVTGLNAVSVTTVSQDPVATAANTVAEGDEVTLTLGNFSGPSNLKFSMLATAG